MVTTAGAFAGEQTCEVAGTIAQQRHGFAVDGREDQFAKFAVGHRFERNRVDDFDDEIVLPDVQAVLFLTFESNARAHHL